MELITYGKTLHRRYSFDNAYILVRRNGRITFSTTSCSILNLSKKNQILFHQRKDDSRIWYLQKVKEGGFVLRTNKAMRNYSLQFSNMFIASKIFESLDISDGISAYIPISPILIKDKYYELQISNAKIKPKRKM
jgi:hypothetical protein